MLSDREDTDEQPLPTSPLYSIRRTSSFDPDESSGSEDSSDNSLPSRPSLHHHHPRRRYPHASRENLMPQTQVAYPILMSRKRGIDDADDATYIEDSEQQIRMHSSGSESSDSDEDNNDHCEEDDDEDMYQALDNEDDLSETLDTSTQSTAVNTPSTGGKSSARGLKKAHFSSISESPPSRKGSHRPQPTLLKPTTTPQRLHISASRSSEDEERGTDSDVEITECRISVASSSVPSYRTRSHTNTVKSSRYQRLSREQSSLPRPLTRYNSRSHTPSVPPKKRHKLSSPVIDIVSESENELWFLRSPSRSSTIP